MTWLWCSSRSRIAAHLASGTVSSNPACSSGESDELASPSRGLHSAVIYTIAVAFAVTERDRIRGRVLGTKASVAIARRQLRRAPPQPVDRGSDPL